MPFGASNKLTVLCQLNIHMQITMIDSKQFLHGNDQGSFSGDRAYISHHKVDSRADSNLDSRVSYSSLSLAKNKSFKGMYPFW